MSSIMEEILRVRFIQIGDMDDMSIYGEIMCCSICAKQVRCYSDIQYNKQNPFKCVVCLSIELVNRHKTARGIEV